MTGLAAVTWPAARLGEAIYALARRSGLAPRAVEIAPPPDAGSPDRFSRWLDVAAGSLGLEVEAVEASYGDVDRLVRAAGPALVRLPGDDGTRFLALLPGRRRALRALGPDLHVHALDSETVRAALCRGLEAPRLPEVETLLAALGVPDRRRARARVAILREQLGDQRVGGCWVLRAPPGASFWRQLAAARLPHRLVGLAAAHAAEYVLWLVSWWMVGRAALSGRLDRGWLLAWALLLLTLVPLRLLSTWWEGRLALGAGGLLRRRLLHGALRLEPEEIRHQGVGQLFGRVLESEAVESLALGGGFLALVSSIELAIAAVVLRLGAGSWPHAFLLAGWVTLACLLAAGYVRQRRRWTDTRLELTHALVERMAGHRTLQVQEPRGRWHEAEDRGLERYHDASRTMDAAAAVLAAFVPRGWLLVGLAGLAPGFVAGAGSPAALAIGLGGVVLAYRALRHFATGLAQVTGAAIAWRQVAPLYHAAARPEISGTPAVVLAAAADAPGDDRALLEAHDLVFRHRDRGEPVLRGASLRLGSRERILLEGPSGAGKSTLVSLLNGLRVPESGLLLLHGLDRQSLGSDAWRRRVVAAPQFHENHVLAGTFAFNLLMGRPWPTSKEEWREVEAVCAELGLAELIERMPAGLLQMVGETGWQLSHGERSRLYIARALLQGAELVVLDESFAALDPENLQRALRCALRRAPTLLVVAHP